MMAPSGGGGKHSAVYLYRPTQEALNQIVQWGVWISSSKSQFIVFGLLSLSGHSLDRKSKGLQLSGFVNG